MEYTDIIKNRYSVRSYSDKKITEEELHYILEAAKYAPTAKNKQPHKIYVLKSDEAIEKINSLCKCIFGAKTVLMVCYDKNEEWTSPLGDNFQSGLVDSTIVCDQMMLAAWNIGIGSCWVGYFNHNEVEKAFNLPENIKINSLLLLGYPSEDSKPMESKHSVYRPMEEIITEL